MAARARAEVCEDKLGGILRPYGRRVSRTYTCPRPGRGRAARHAGSLVIICQFGLESRARYSDSLSTAARLPTSLCTHVTCHSWEMASHTWHGIGNFEPTGTPADFAALRRRGACTAQLEGCCSESEEQAAAGAAVPLTSMVQVEVCCGRPPLQRCAAQRRALLYIMIESLQLQCQHMPTMWQRMHAARSRTRHGDAADAARPRATRASHF